MKRALELTFLALLVSLVLLGAQKTLDMQGEVPGDAIVGGRIYDNWIIALDAPLPAENHPLWDSQDFNQRSGVITWRCVECHGWDYKGFEGAYGSYSNHYTGFPGLDSAVGASQEQVIQWLDGTFNLDHNFLQYTSITDLNDLAAFLRTQQVDSSLMINPSTGASLGNRENGQAIYFDSCEACHGLAGNAMNFGNAAAPVYLGDFAVGNPWRTVHKIRFGSPGNLRMPASEDLNWSLGMVADVLAHLQTLPRGNPDVDILTAAPSHPGELEHQAQIEPIVWAAVGLVGFVALSVGWDFYSQRKAGH